MHKHLVLMPELMFFELKCLLQEFVAKEEMDIFSQDCGQVHSCKLLHCQSCTEHNYTG